MAESGTKNISIPEPQPSPPLDDKRAIDEDKEYRIKYQRELREEKLKWVRQLIKQMEGYAKKVFYLCLIWIVIVVIIILLNGFNLLGFNLADIVLTTLVGTSTVNILGLLIIVLKYIYNPKNLDIFKEISN